MKKLILSVLCVLLAASAFAQSGVTLPEGSNTLKALHLKNYPGVGIYSPSAGALYFGNETEGFYCTAGGTCTLASTGTPAFAASIELEGATADANETTITVADPTADRTVTLADASGTVMLSTLATNAPSAAASVWAVSNRLTFEGATADNFETEITVTDPTQDNLVTLPNTSGTAVLSNVFNYAIPDSGDGAAAAYTLQAYGYRLATLSCLDAHGCTVTMGETGLIVGDSVTIIQIAAGSGNITIVDDDGTTAELDGDANLVLNTLDSVTLHYTPGTWVQTAYIDIS
jgi:hypothetical protein